MTRHAPHHGLCMLLAVLLMVGCTDDARRHFHLQMERYGTSHAKMAVSGTDVQWGGGETVWINGQTATVVVDNGTPQISLEVASADGYYNAASPASLVQSMDHEGLNIHLPSHYQYRQSQSGTQQYEAPVVARCVTGGETMYFHHLASALQIALPEVGTGVYVDYIRVKSSAYALSGTAHVAYSTMGDNPQLDFTTDTCHSVTMHFDSTRLELSTSRTVLIPVAPVTNQQNTYTVTICAHSGTTTKTFRYFHQTSNPGGLARHELAHVPIPSLPTAIPFPGQGTAQDPYLLQTKEDYKNFLYLLGNQPVDGFAYSTFKMTNDIDFGGETITSVYDNFCGIFDGNSKALSNAAIACTTVTNSHYISLFPVLSDCEVKDLTVKDIQLNAPRQNLTNIYLGGVAALAISTHSYVRLDNVRVVNLSVNGTLQASSYTYYGGFVGCIQGHTSTPMEMNNCTYRLPDNTSETIIEQGNPPSSVPYYGGLVGNVNSARLNITSCTLHFGVSTGGYGCTWAAPSHYYPCMGSLIGKSSGTVQIINGLTISGSLLFVGNNSTYVRRYIGYQTGTFSGDNLITEDDFTFNRKPSWYSTTIYDIQ